MARLSLHEYLAGGVWANLHKANFILYFSKHFIKPWKGYLGNVTWVVPWSFEKLHGLSHVISHGLGHDVFKRVSWVEPGKTHGLGHDGFENGYLGWARWNLMGWAMIYIYFFETKHFVNFEDIWKIIRGWQLWSLLKSIMGWQPRC